MHEDKGQNICSGDRSVKKPHRVFSPFCEAFIERFVIFLLDLVSNFALCFLFLLYLKIWTLKFLPNVEKSGRVLEKQTWQTTFFFSAGEVTVASWQVWRIWLAARRNSSPALGVSYQSVLSSSTSSATECFESYATDGPSHLFEQEILGGNSNRYEEE
ncbi:basic helix-loop-helix (bHLH) DNA-bindingsuperfamily protein [Striga asiatica]|uniref:Basic helix-loop-helix (BHLH) DNA-bindingsuperfamily protein n=1 Tax=Striga asiatica TaxID=4170 RepID=A0A5A7Q7T2_STRAF|nr:basic helix-loop-helix (bHLH) DNA-bindingsuperfamily protein [Striga asiatica]